MRRTYADTRSAVTADPVPKSKAKKIRLPWEIGTMFTEHLVNSTAAGDEDDELDEEDAEALEDSLQRLRVSRCIEGIVCVGRAQRGVGVQNAKPQRVRLKASAQGRGQEQGGANEKPSRAFADLKHSAALIMKCICDSACLESETSLSTCYMRCLHRARRTRALLTCAHAWSSPHLPGRR